MKKKPYYADYQRAYRKRTKNAAVHKHILKKLYNMTLEEYQRILDQQGGVCAICGQPSSQTRRDTGTIYRLHVDHCHKTGINRGLLCTACNTRVQTLEHILFQPILAYLARTMSTDPTWGTFWKGLKAYTDQTYPR